MARNSIKNIVNGTAHTANTYLFLFLLLSVYILFAKMFPCIRIPFSSFSADTTDAFNDVLESLSVGYISGLFVYYLTVILKDKISRRKRKWEIYDVFMEINCARAYVEKELGIRYQVMSVNDYKSFFTKDVKNLFTDMLSNSLEKTRLYENLLTEKENDEIANIRANMDLSPYEGLMSDIFSESNFNKLKEICRSIDYLNSSIIKEVKKK